VDFICLTQPRYCCLNPARPVSGACAVFLNWIWIKNFLPLSSAKATEERAKLKYGSSPDSEAINDPRQSRDRCFSLGFLAIFSGADLQSS